MRTDQERLKYRDFIFIGPNVEIGENCKIQPFAFIPDNVKIGNNVFIGPHACFTNDKYPPSSGAWKENPPTIVEDDVMIGAGAIILPGLLIGRGATIGAGSVVTKDVLPYSVIVGKTERLLKYQYRISNETVFSW